MTQQQTYGFGSRPINLMSRTMNAAPSLGKTGGKSGFKLPSLITDDDDLNDLKGNDLKIDQADFGLNLPGEHDRKKTPTSFINSEEGEEIPGVNSETAKSTTEAA